MQHTKLSVNLNKVALIRNARGNNLPNLKQVAIDCERFGANGITVHPRPDERHCKYSDLYDLKEVVTTELNIEGYPNSTFLQHVLAVKPQQCTLVPDLPNQLTSDHGWDTIQHQSFLKEVIHELHQNNIRVSLFINPEIDKIEAAKTTKTDRIELYTGSYAHQYPTNPQQAIAPFKEAALFAQKIGLEINAGHDLNLNNVPYFIEQIPFIAEVSIGHALISDALYLGLENTIQLYLRAVTTSK